MIDEKNITPVLLEVYKQESENIRFFEDLVFKLHFFVFTGITGIIYFLFTTNVDILKSNEICQTRSLSAIVLIVVIVICYTTHSKHVKRMKRLSKISKELGLHSLGIYKPYTNSVYKEYIIIILYVLLILFFRFFI